jgi:hypothetical protein
MPTITGDYTLGDNFTRVVSATSPRDEWASGVLFRDRDSIHPDVDEGRVLCFAALAASGDQSFHPGDFIYDDSLTGKPGEPGEPGCRCDEHVAAYLAMTVSIRREQAEDGMYIVIRGNRVQIAGIVPGEPVQFSIRRPGYTINIQPGEQVALDPDQGFCVACYHPLTFGVDEEAHSLRTTTTGRYFCPDSDDSLHHPRKA